MFGDEIALSQKLLETTEALKQLSLEHWYHYELFTWQWWLKFTYLIIPILLLIRYLDWKRSFEILSYGLIISLISTVIDIIGVNLLWWHYPIRFLPFGFFAVHDLVFIPIVALLIFQRYNSWKSFCIVNLLLAAVGAYIEEPLAAWIGIYKPLQWKHTYSFFLFFGMTLLSRFIIVKLRAASTKAVQ